MTVKGDLIFFMLRMKHDLVVERNLSTFYIQTKIKNFNLENIALNSLVSEYSQNEIIKNVCGHFVFCYRELLNYDTFDSTYITKFWHGSGLGMQSDYPRRAWVSVYVLVIK